MRSVDQILSDMVEMVPLGDTVPCSITNHEMSINTKICSLPGERLNHHVLAISQSARVS
jgi:hypothetical protein